MNYCILLTDNMTEALLFLAHFMGDIHQVTQLDHFMVLPMAYIVASRTHISQLNL